MTDTETKTMKQLARELDDSLTKDVERIRRLAALSGDRGEDAGNELADELGERPLSAEVETRINVTLYTGGPAGGVEFVVDMSGKYPEMTSAHAWHQEWFQSKGWSTLDDDTAEYLWYHWSLDSLLCKD